MADEQAQALRQLEDRLDRAAAAAEKLVAQAGAAAIARVSGRTAGGGPKPEAAPGAPAEPSAGELQLLAEALHNLRGLVPADLADRVSGALRELLLSVRALIDWYVERIDRRAEEAPPVEDIPIL